MEPRKAKPLPIELFRNQSFPLFACINRAFWLAANPALQCGENSAH
jgi:hypothetical protein